MKIAIDAGPSFPVPAIRGGAVNRFWSQVAPRWVAAGHEVTILARNDPAQPPDECIEGVRYRRHGGFDAGRRPLVNAARTLAHALASQRRLQAADCYITNDVFSPWLMGARGLASRTLVAAGRAPKGQYRWMPRGLSVAVPSEAVRRAIIAEAPRLEPRLHLLPYAIDTARFHPEHASPPQRSSRWLYAGRIHPEKGVHLLVQAFARFASSRPAAQLTLLGPVEAAEGGGGADYLSRLQMLAKGARVEFLAPTYDTTALAGHYRACAYFVYPSLAETGETFGVAPLEAMACGAIPVVSALACFEDFVRDGRNGFVFDHRSGDPVAALEAALERAEGADASVAGAALQSAVQFSIDAIATRWRGVIETIAQAASRR